MKPFELLAEAAIKGAPAKDVIAVGVKELREPGSVKNSIEQKLGKGRSQAVGKESVEAVKWLDRKIASNGWITVNEMAVFCPSCAKVMEAKGFSRVRPSQLTFNFKEQKGWEKPSYKKAYGTLVKGKKGKKGEFTQCMTKMRGKVDDPAAYCMSLKVKGGVPTS